MSGPIRLYHQLHRALKVLGKWGRPEGRQTLALLMTGIFHSRDVRLSRIAENVPLDIQEDSVAQRFRRWLKNPRNDTRAIYDPVARQLLVSLRHTRLRLQIDRTMIDDRFNVLMVSIAYRRRAIPLAWMVLSHLGNSTFMEREELLSHIDELLPVGATVLVLGDREFGTPDMMRSVRGYGWDYCLRVKGTSYAYLPTGCWMQLRELAPSPGAHYYLTDVRLTKAHDYGPLHFALACDDASDDPWFIATNGCPSQRTLRDYARRFGCEELFSDIKARGFNLALSQLQHPDRFSRLLVAIALLYVWVLCLARRICITRQMRALTYRLFEQRYSLFQIGRRWLAKQLTLGKSLVPDPAFQAWSLV
jgi:hypothetical protein